MSAEPAARPERVADVWANWWDRALFEALPGLDALYVRLGIGDRAGATVERLTEEADAGAVDRIVLSATAFPGSSAGNDAVADVVGRFPERLVGCASVDPTRGMASVRELRRAVESLGFRGLKLLPFVYDRPPNDAIYYPLYAACVELDVPVLVLTGHTAVMRRSELGRPLHLDDVALHFPELTIVAGHAGYPWTDELISLAWKHANLHIDTSGHRPRHLPAGLLRFLDSYGREKVMFGTGYPFMDFEGPVTEARALDLRPEALEGYLWGNAARVWGWR